MLRTLLLPLLTLVFLAPSVAIAQGPPGGFDPDGLGQDPLRPQFGDSRDRVGVYLIPAATKVAPGDDLPLALVFDIDPGWHIWANARSLEEGQTQWANAIQTEVTAGENVTLAPMVHPGFVKWPEVHELTINLGDGPMEYPFYVGRAIAHIPATIPDDAAPGKYTLTVNVTIQACDDTTCLMPAFEVPITTDIEVVEAGALELPAELTGDFAGFPTHYFTPIHSGETAPPDAKPTDATTRGGPSTPAHDEGGFKWKTAHWWGALFFAVAGMIWMIIRTLAITQRIVIRAVVIVIGVGVMLIAYSFVRGITAASNIPWVPYSHAAFNDAKNRGDIVFIKFTADWCANCQVNEALIQSSDEAVRLLNQPGTTALKVDFTGPNPEGDERKAEHGGGGIPLIAVYHPGEEPIAIRGQLASAQPVISAIMGEETTSAGEGEMIFDFLGWRFAIGQDAVFIILGLAFLAGFFMNFTPCVLPVVPLKILSLQAHAKDPRRCFLLGLIFGLGIVALYAALGILIAGLITGIEKLDWGDQFQHWWLNGIIGIVVAAMGLGMMGLFTIQIPKFLYMFNPQSDSASGSFFMGVFTAVLSTPCTGPLLGATIAWVATQPASIAFLTLLVMGLGMAFPYVLLTAKPGWLNKLPRTGPGSELIKQVMGILLLAVAVYFFGVTINSLRAGSSGANNTAPSAPLVEDGQDT